VADIAWPVILADLTAKRDALTHAIDVIARHFLPAAAELVIHVPEPEPLPAPRPRAPKPGRPKKKERAHQPWMPASPPAAAGAVQARDEAIVNALRKGPAATHDLLPALPAEPGQTPEQRDNALRNTLTRLRCKKRIKQLERGEWALVA